MFTIPQSSPIFLVVYIETIPTRSPFWKNPSHHLRACGHSCPSPKAGWDYAPLTRTGRLGPTPSRPPTADPLASPATSFSSEHFRVLLRRRVRLPPLDRRALPVWGPSGWVWWPPQCMPHRWLPAHPRPAPWTRRRPHLPRSRRHIAHQHPPQPDEPAPPPVRLSGDRGLGDRLAPVAWSPATLVSPVGRDGMPRRRADTHPGATVQEAAGRKRTHADLPGIPQFPGVPLCGLWPWNRRPVVHRGGHLDPPAGLRQDPKHLPLGSPAGSSSLAPVPSRLPPKPINTDAQQKGVWGKKKRSWNKHAWRQGWKDRHES